MHNYAYSRSVECSNRPLQRSNLIFTENFEKEEIETNWNLANWNLEVCSTCSYAVRKVSSLARSGLYATRFELRQNDPEATSGNKRAELTRTISEPNGKRERWYGFSIYLSPDYRYDYEAEIVTQWHAIPDKSAEGLLEKWRSPPLALLTFKGKWQVDWRWDQRKITLDAPKIKQRRLSEYTRGEWTDWVFHVHWSYEKDGSLEVWKNGEKVLSYKGPIGYNDDRGIYMKMGLYKWAWHSRESFAKRRIIYIDEVSMGDEKATYCDVAPRKTDNNF